MKLFVYSIYDSVAEVFNKPFTDINDGSAIRNFTNSILQQDMPDVQKNDYVLYLVGEWNDSEGTIKPVLPSKIYSGFDIKSEI